MDYFKTKLKNEELAEGGRCSHLGKFEEKFQIAECCITDLPEGLRHSDFPKCEFSQKPILTMLKNRYRYLGLEIFQITMVQYRTIPLN